MFSIARNTFRLLKIIVMITLNGWTIYIYITFCFILFKKYVRFVFEQTFYKNAWIICICISYHWMDWWHNPLETTETSYVRCLTRKQWLALVLWYYDESWSDLILMNKDLNVYHVTRGCCNLPLIFTKLLLVFKLDDEFKRVIAR